jgi:hypothetical protein
MQVLASDFTGNSADAKQHYYKFNNRPGGGDERVERVKGQLESLWPELDLLSKKLSIDKIHCS